MPKDILKKRCVMKKILIFSVALFFIAGCDASDTNINNGGSIPDNEFLVPHPNPADSSGEFPPQAPEV
jgi:hypothetical protein